MYDINLHKYFKDWLKRVYSFISHYNASQEVSWVREKDIFHISVFVKEDFQNKAPTYLTQSSIHQSCNNPKKLW